MISLREVQFGYGNTMFLGPISLTVERGVCWGIVGPNGAGKSTLLRLMAGLLIPLHGEIRVDGQCIGNFSGRQRAQRIAFVPQVPAADIDIGACDFVLMGRFPHHRWGLFESSGDHSIARATMQATHTDVFADRTLNMLSGGERQRVYIAAALCQGSPAMLLDEPTASLDLQHQMEMFQILRDAARTENKAIVVVTHDLNLARGFCDQVMLLSDGQPVAVGPPESVLTPEVLTPVYRVPLGLASVQDSKGAWLVALDERASNSRA